MKMNHILSGLGIVLFSGLGLAAELPADRWKGTVLNEVMANQIEVFRKTYGQETFDQIISVSVELRPAKYREALVKISYQKPGQTEPKSKSYLCHEHGGPDDIDCH